MFLHHAQKFKKIYTSFSTGTRVTCAYEKGVYENPSLRANRQLQNIDCKQSQNVDCKSQNNDQSQIVNRQSYIVVE